MGLNRVGEKTISERAFYYMRRRVVEYEEKTGINLFEKIFISSVMLDLGYLCSGTILLKKKIGLF